MNQHQRRLPLTALAITLCAWFLPFPMLRAQNQSTAPDAAAITAAVDGFTSALQKGEAAAAMELLAPDALILESGSKQTRDEYGKEHLQEDMAMLKSVPMTRSDLIVRQEGSAAWATSLYRISGTFAGKEINSQGAELMVLTKTSAGWKIRAIHWSNHAIKAKQP